MDTALRLKEIISYSKLSERAFALACGIKQPTLDKQLRGGRSVSLETIKAICAKFPEVSRDWVLFGDGEMLKSQNKEIERLNLMMDTISTLQGTINAKNDTIAMLNERIKQLENQLSNK